MYCTILIVLFGSTVLSTWNAASGYSTTIYPISSNSLYKYSDLLEQFELIKLEGGSIKLVGSTNDHVYLGGLNQLYQLNLSNLQSEPEVVAVVGSEQWPMKVKYLYLLGNPASTAFVCAASAASSVQSGMTRSGSGTCQFFNISAELPWQQVEWAHSPRDWALLTSFLMPSWPLEPPRVSIRLNESHAFISSYPQMHDTLDIIELRWPRFDRIGWLTADFQSRRNREPWISRSARPVAMATRGEKLYTFFTEEALEVSNYYSSVSGDSFRSSSAIIKLPRFTRLARICLNDPGVQPASEETRVMSSFFKMRLICRNGSVDYDVLELVTEVWPSEPGAFYGLFSLQNSPAGAASHRALCRFDLAEAESLISSSEFIQLVQEGRLSYTAKRLSRSAYAEAAGRSNPTRCNWTTEEAKQLPISFLRVEHTAPLLARPLISESVLTFNPVPDGAGIASILWLESDAAGDMLAFGTESGSLIKVFVPNAASNIPAYAIETLQLFPPAAGSPGRIDSLMARSGRLFAVSDNAGVGVWLPMSRCGLAKSCSSCVALRDPSCSWRLDSHACLFAAEPAGLSNVSSGVHTGCPISLKDLVTGGLKSTSSTGGVHLASFTSVLISLSILGTLISFL